MSAEFGYTELQEAPLLSDLFSIGQLVACTVRKLEVIQERKGRGKSEKDSKYEKKGRRIELSLKLKYLYDGLSIDAVHEGQVKLKRPMYIDFSKVGYDFRLLLDISQVSLQWTTGLIECSSLNLFCRPCLPLLQVLKTMAICFHLEFLLYRVSYYTGTIWMVCLQCFKDIYLS